MKRRHIESSAPADSPGPDRGGLLLASLISLNTQYASWIQEQKATSLSALWTEAARDYIRHAETIMSTFSDVIPGGGSAPAVGTLPDNNNETRPLNPPSSTAPIPAPAKPALPLPSSFLTQPAATSALPLPAWVPTATLPASSPVLTPPKPFLFPKITHPTQDAAPKAVIPPVKPADTSPPLSLSAETTVPHNAGTLLPQNSSLGAPSTFGVPFGSNSNKPPSFGGAGGVQTSMFGSHLKDNSASAAPGPEHATDNKPEGTGMPSLFGSSSDMPRGSLGTGAFGGQVSGSGMGAAPVQPGALLGNTTSAGIFGKGGSTFGGFGGSHAPSALGNGNSEADVGPMGSQAEEEAEAVDPMDGKSELISTTDDSIDVLFSEKGMLIASTGSGWGARKLGNLTIRRSKVTASVWVQIVSESGSIVMYAAIPKGAKGSLVDKGCILTMSVFKQAPGLEPTTNGDASKNGPEVRPVMIKVNAKHTARLEKVLIEVGCKVVSQQ